MPSFRENQARMEELDPQNRLNWRKIKSTQHRTLAKFVREAEAAELASIPEETATPTPPPLPKTRSRQPRDSPGISSDEDWGTPTLRPVTPPRDAAAVRQLLGQRRETIASPDDSPESRETTPVITQSSQDKAAAREALTAFLGRTDPVRPRTPPRDNIEPAQISASPRDKLDPIREPQPQPQPEKAISLSPEREVPGASLTEDQRQEVLQDTPLGRAIAAREGTTPVELRQALDDPEAFKRATREGIQQKRQSQSIAIPRTRSEADLEAEETDAPSPSLGPRASSIRMQHPHVATALQDYSTVRQTAMTDAADAIRADSGKFASKEAATKALDNLEQAPLTARLFERGLLSADSVSDPQYVRAMEDSLRLREERTGTVKTASARRSYRPTYTRTVTRRPGVYQYRRPHFDTAPMYRYTSQEGDGIKDAAQFLYTLGKATIGTKKSKQKTRKQFLSGAKSAVGL
eukprot:COSAG01_NODE_9029_length_2577_cov_80.088781_1_plen_464_part_00